MGTFTHATAVVRVHVIDITKVKNVVNVVDGAVSSACLRLMRALSEARYLSARLLSCLGAGLWSLAKCQGLSAAPATMWAHQPAMPGGARLRRPVRLGRPRSASGLTRF